MPFEVYDTSVDAENAHDPAGNRPEFAAKAREIFAAAHVDPEWNRNPNESNGNLDAKRSRAEAGGSLQIPTRANAPYLLADRSFADAPPVASDSGIPD